MEEEELFLWLFEWFNWKEIENIQYVNTLEVELMICKKISRLNHFTNPATNNNNCNSDDGDGDGDTINNSNSVYNIQTNLQMDRSTHLICQMIANGMLTQWQNVKPQTTHTHTHTCAAILFPSRRVAFANVSSTSPK